MKGYLDNIEQKTRENTAFRAVLYTAKHTQLVVMSLLPGESIGEEIHTDTDQFFRFETGQGQVMIDGMRSEVKDGDVVVVPAGAKHNVTNISATETLKLYTLYSPPHHRDGVRHETKSIAELDDEHFDGTISA